MMRLHDEFADELVGLFVDVNRFEQHSVEKVLGLLKDLERDLVRQIREFGDDGRRGQLLAQARASIFSSYDAQADLIASEVREIADVVSRSATQGLNAVANGDRIFSRTAFTIADVEAATNGSLIRGAKIKEWARGQRENVVRQFGAQMRLGLLEGDTVDDLIDRIRGRKSSGFEEVRGLSGKARKVRTYKGGVINGIARNQAETLARTGIQTLSNEALRVTYEGNDDVIKGVTTIATLDRRTSDICISRDGSSWSLESGEPMPGSPRGEPFPGYPPWHWRCRSVLAPLTYSWEELAARNGGSVPRKFKERIKSDSTRASMGGPLPADKTYHKWLGDKPEVFQKEILGPSRWKLWKDGKITAHQLINAKGRTLSIDELRQRRNLVQEVPK